jgi:sirohydrochlorin cobaltochelatase
MPEAQAGPLENLVQASPERQGTKGAIRVDRRHQPESFRRIMSMRPPIVLTAFGTTSKALETYDFIDKIIKEEFPGFEIHWAFSSRMVRDRLKQNHKLEMKHPHEILQKLAAKGHVWAVVQSLHLLGGHEFYRLLEEVRPLEIRTSIGLPLLSSYEDYQNLARALGSDGVSGEEEALVLVGHGTDHPSWSTYPALENILREVHGHRVFVGVVEGFPSQEQVLRAISRAGVSRVRLIPLMLVAGVHFWEDLCEGEDSWRAAFEEAGLEVQVDPRGLGANKGVIQIFVDHIREALDIIPGSDHPSPKGLAPGQARPPHSLRIPG